MLPVLDFSNTVAELEYLANKGFTAAMLPAVSPPNLPKYNDEKWDVVFAKGAELGIVFVMHTGTGLESVVIERGPGAGIINYSNQMMDACTSVMYLVSEDGREWRQVPVPTRSTLTSVTSADGVLWAGGHDGVIVHSTDGGQTWVRRRAAPWSYDIVDPSEGVPVMDLLFTDAMNGFAIGAYSLMLATTDGGVTWEPRSIIDHGDDAAAGGAPTADAGEGPRQRVEF